MEIFLKKEIISIRINGIRKIVEQKPLDDNFNFHIYSNFHIISNIKWEKKTY